MVRNEGTEILLVKNAELLYIDDHLRTAGAQLALERIQSALLEQLLPPSHAPTNTKA